MTLSARREIPRSDTAQRIMHGTVAAGLNVLIANRAVSSETAAALREP